MSKKKKQLCINNGEESYTLLNSNCSNTIHYKGVIFNITVFKDIKRETGFIPFCSIEPECPIGMFKKKFYSIVSEYYNALNAILEMRRNCSSDKCEHDFSISLSENDNSGMLKGTISYFNTQSCELYLGDGRWELSSPIIFNSLMKAMILTKKLLLNIDKGV